MTASNSVPSWWIYRGMGEPSERIRELPPPPPWRRFSEPPDEDDHDFGAPRENGATNASGRRLGYHRQAISYQANDEEIDLINLALHLRRPLLVTGQPGVGKSTLAYSVAYELGLGPVLRWPITSRSTLTEGLYNYDAIGRLQEVSLQRESRRARNADGDGTVEPPDIGRYLRLGALGTALLPRRRPRALLIDEIDKSDVDLPGDLLNVFEEGEFVIPELARLRQRDVKVMTADEGVNPTLHGGRVQCHEFPLVVLTSNSERAFPKPFLRRCLRLHINQPDRLKLTRMVEAHLEPTTPETAELRRELITTFLKKQEDQAAILANDQLLNALLMASADLWSDERGQQIVTKHLLRPLD